MYLATFRFHPVLPVAIASGSTSAKEHTKPNPLVAGLFMTVVLLIISYDLMPVIPS